jgi:hypothetical protein
MITFLLCHLFDLIWSSFACSCEPIEPFAFFFSPLCFKEFDLDANQCLLPKKNPPLWRAVGPIGYRFVVGHLYQE